MAAAGVTLEVVRERQDLVRENLALKEQVEKKLAEGDRRFNRWMLFVTLIIVCATAVGLIFQGSGTRYFLDQLPVQNAVMPPGEVAAEHAPVEETPAQESNSILNQSQ